MTTDVLEPTVETVENPEETSAETAVTALVLPPDQQGKLDEINQNLVLARQQVKTLSIDTKEGRKQVKQTLSALVSTRTGTVKLADTIVAPQKEFIKSVFAVRDSIIAEVRGLENEVRPLKEEFEAIEAREKEEREKAAAAKLQERTQAVINLGMVWDGVSSYQFGEFLIDSVEIKACPDEQWQEIIDEVTAHVNEVRENERIAAQQAQQRQQEEQDQLNRQREEQQAAQKLINDQKKEAAKMIFDARSERLTGLGLTLEKDGFYIDKPLSHSRSIVFSRDGVQNISSEEFSRHVTGLIQHIADTRQKDEQEAADNALFNQRRSMMFDVSTSFETDIYDELHYTYERAEIIAFSDEEFQQLLTNSEKRNTEYKAEQERLERAQRQADQIRNNRLKVERGVFVGHLEKLKKIASPKPDQPEFADLVNDFNKEFSYLIEKYRELAVNL